jgi:hypothetical protein
MTNVRILRFPTGGTISEVRYNLATGAMLLRFPKTNSTWEFDEVDPGDFALLCLATSPGEVFNTRVRGRYQGRRVEPKDLSRT